MKNILSRDSNIHLRVGYWAAVVSCSAAFGYSVVQLLQVLGLVHYPLDAILIYGFSLVIAAPFLLAMLALHYIAPDSKKFWSHAALLFAMMYNVFVTIMYVVQLGAVIPYNITDPVLTVTPHSLFWTLDALGYIAMGVATLFGSYVFYPKGFQKRVKYFFLAHALCTVPVAFVYFYPSFSVAVLLIALPWIVTAPGSMLVLALHFRRLILEGQNGISPSAQKPNGGLRFEASLKVS